MKAKPTIAAIALAAGLVVAWTARVSASDESIHYPQPADEQHFQFQQEVALGHAEHAVQAAQRLHDFEGCVNK